MSGMPGGNAPEMQDFERVSLSESLHLLKWLFSVTNCKISSMVYIIVNCAVVAVISILMPSLIGKTIDTLMNPGLLLQALAVLIVLNLVITLLSMNQGFAIPRLTQHISHRLRRTLYSRMLRLPIYYVDAHPHGDCMSRLTNDTENVVQTLSQVIPAAVSSVITLAGCLLIMLRISPRITGINLLIGVVAMLPCSLLSRKIFGAAEKQQKNLGRLNSQVENSFSRRRSILLADSAGFECRKTAQIGGEFMHSAISMQILAGIMEPMMVLFGSGGFILTIAIGVRGIESGLMTVGMLQACLIYARQLLKPFQDAGRTFAQLQGCAASIVRIKELMGVREDAVDKNYSVPPEEVKGEICFSDVDFSYIRGRELYKNLNLVIPAGKTTAIVGETGAGKTTLMNLLLRFYNPDSGQILLDGVSIHDWNRKRLYNSIAVILQDEVTTARSVLDLVLYGQAEEKFSQEEVMEALAKVHADKIVESLPQGLDTPLLDEDVLSRGQKQLIALARVPLNNARVLIFDEATSSVDPYTEQMIQDSLNELRQGRTCIIIAHRLSTIRNADCIVKVEHGHVTVQEEQMSAS